MKYEELVISIVEFDMDDIIVTSTGDDYSGNYTPESKEFPVQP